ncbi:glutathione S-transferase [Methylomonas koyamae]|uniref:glutathione S-transferase n=1 Tax=Methylomonas koyamae TaxID=702114 RepID=UPI00210F6C64|nr:glutathione S-transferase [Methylomonas koyamae]
MTDSSYPILYSFRRCPYAMRARLAIAAAGICVALREIELRAKPAAMLAVSPKGTVPVLVLANGQVIDESLDIMVWALTRHDPQDWLNVSSRADADRLIAVNDSQFKYWLDRYKYADRYPEHSAEHYREQGELFLADLEQRLQRNGCFCGRRFGLADAAILPFVRQFAAVDAAWFALAPYPALRAALQHFVESELFGKIMAQYPVWQATDPASFSAPNPAGAAYVENLQKSRRHQPEPGPSAIAAGNKTAVATPNRAVGYPGDDRRGHRRHLGVFRAVCHPADSAIDLGLQGLARLAHCPTPTGRANPGRRVHRGIDGTRRKPSRPLT